ncbi:MAG: putative DNA modification/repair radical SAM protein [Firmicutes bacterium]|nr:putative DNA modification/repair radical SAM protein [Bacillota bacterium]
MEVSDKVNILSAAAKYDVSCSSSGSRRKNIPGGVGNASVSGICHSWTDDGRCVSLLKILFSNDCCYDCVYCVNRISNDTPRASFSPDEMADLTINFYRRNYIEGLFLSSAIIKNEDYTMEQLLLTVKKLRHQHRFNGYIHLKAIPGADSRLISEAGMHVDRMSVNIELPSEKGLKLLAPRKKKEQILGSMGNISSNIVQFKEERKVFKHTPSFVPAGQSTQLIVGATPDNDKNIITLSENLYRSFSLKRVYYSAYVPVNDNPKLPSLTGPPLVRENRLYQADWLLRFYGFKASELLDEKQPNFDLQLDPKAGWALRNLNVFPVEINRADYLMLLRVPGIGVKSAKRIVIARRVGSLSYDDLKKIGVVLKRARYFITCRGKYYGGINLREDAIRPRLLDGSSSNGDVQMTMFD